MKGKVCVFGSFNIDVVARVDRLPCPGESLLANNSVTSGGGKGSNQAIASLRTGANVHYIGKIGDDTFGQIGRRYLKSVGFNVLTLFSTNEKATGNALIYVSESSAENMIVADPGANMTVTEEEINKCVASIECADLLLLQLENNLSAVRQVIDIGYKNDIFIVLNPIPRQPLDDALLAKVNVLTPDAIEASYMTGVKVIDLNSAAKAADILHAKGTQYSIIALGEMGYLLSLGAEKIAIPNFKSQAKDTTGVADAFNGALVGRLANGDSLKDAAMYASAYASVSAEKFGASTPFDLSEVEEKLASL
ncbi:ribokinase [Vibrio superstes]|uniref:Ribokinase n=1 Tax=Vibrio superstes NBRC 103154 TaxID=1219062 RepID=A0A511QVN0_9VIBR|nr:ribokinase [Vibrio superstes]GEM81420.1 ribokinase [Vibrio superstes NBRC 103154]